MKIIDQTPFYNEKGELSFSDRTRAFMKYGKAWLNEMEAQKSVLPVFEKNLDRKYTLLRNVILPGLETPIPFILVGPTGIYVMYVTPIIGMFRAKGDQWGTISGSAFKTEKTNLLTRTERMSRAVSVFLQRQGYVDLTGIEAVLLCADAAVHVDSLRPIVRIVMRDALERFIISITQARVSLSPEMVFDLVNRITTPPTPKEEIPAPESIETPPAQENQAPFEKHVPIKQQAVVPDAQNAPAFIPLESELPPAAPSKAMEFVTAGVEQESAPPEIETSRPRKARGISKKQWLFLILMAIIWCALVGVFIYFVVQDMFL
jgi:hypothetical protein